MDSSDNKDSAEFDSFIEKLKEEFGSHNCNIKGCIHRAHLDVIDKLAGEELSR